jgi:glycerol-3-phosphate dehydrogenase
MAESAVDMVLQKLERTCLDFPCQTEQYTLIGSQHLEQVASLPESLVQRYGDQASKIIEIATEEDAEALLHEALEINKAELLYTIRHEYVRKPLDFIVRRVNLGLIDQKHATELVHTVSLILKDELGISDDKIGLLEEESHRLLKEGV